MGPSGTIHAEEATPKLAQRKAVGKSWFSLAGAELPGSRRDFNFGYENPLERAKEAPRQRNSDPQDAPYAKSCRSVNMQIFVSDRVFLILPARANTHRSWGSCRIPGQNDMPPRTSLDRPWSRSGSGFDGAQAIECAQTRPGRRGRAVWILIGLRTTTSASACATLPRFLLSESL
jgi:hypothetical protein